MTDIRSGPPPKEVQEFLFKQASIGQICEEFQNIPISSSLLTIDGKRGLLYLGHECKVIIVKPANDSSPEWKVEIELPDKIHRIGLNCDSSLLAVTFCRPSVLIYDTNCINQHKLELLHEIRLSTSGGAIFVLDLKWNPAIPEMFCSVTSDHTIGSFQVSKEKKVGVQIVGMEKLQGLEALCVSWSPKGKQLVIGCKNGNIAQLKPELKLARHLPAPNPSEGIIISILWISNYQFCACFFNSNEQRVSVMIIDAPKGGTVGKFINYEDITFGSGSLDGLCYYFEHIPEWGIIIAASTHSSEVAVLGTCDNGVNWNLWQLMDDSTAQLPLNRKKKTENFPVGIGIDKAITHKLPWGTENTLLNPLPILRILVTSGQMCCYHMVNLKENVPAICIPPTEIIPAPQLPRPSLGPSEVSFNINAGITSTPRSNKTVLEAQLDKPKLATNIFGHLPNSNFPITTTSNQVPFENTARPAIQNLCFPPPTETKTDSTFEQGAGATGVFQQKNKPVFSPQAEQQVNQLIAAEAPQIAQAEVKSNYPLKPHNRVEMKTSEPTVPAKTELKVIKDQLTEQAHYHQDDSKHATKELSVYDDGLCLQAYYEEQVKFEKEIKSRYDLPAWICGTDEERKILVKNTNDIEEFLKELRETTNSLASDIAYLKALLLQSFAWLEETKSKNSANDSICSKSRPEGSKLADLERFYYYVQTQLIQATKVLDLEWADHKNSEMGKMKIPRLEIIYQTLIRYRQIIAQEKKNLDDLSKKWRAVGRGKNNLSNLDRSMASLNLSHSTSMQLNDTAIALRCKLIAANTRNFTREKQIKLKDLLSESAPRIIRAARPTAVQDRLEATLSSLASKKSSEASGKSRLTKTAVVHQKSTSTPSPAEVQKAKPQNPLSSLDNFVSGIGSSASGLSAPNKSPNTIAVFSSADTRQLTAATATSQIKNKENILVSFSQSITGSQYQISPNQGKPLEKVDSIGFGNLVQKSSEVQASKEHLNKPISVEPFLSKCSNVSNYSHGYEKLYTFQNSSMGTDAVSSTLSMTPPTSTFSFSAPSASLPSFTLPAKSDNSSSIQFSTKLSMSPGQQAPDTQGLTNLSTLSFGNRLGLSITTVADTKSIPVTSVPSLTFTKIMPTSTPQQQQQQQQQPISIFVTQASTPGVAMQSLFGKASASLASETLPSQDKAPTVSTSTATTAQETVASVPASVPPTPLIFQTSLFGGLSSAVSSMSTFSFTPSTVASTVATTTATNLPTISLTSTPTAALPSASKPSFAGILGATTSLSFGTPTTNASIAPAFTKSSTAPTSNIFGATTSASISTAFATSPELSKSNPSVTSTTSPTQLGGPTTTSATKTTTPLIFANSSAPSTCSSIFGGQTTVSSSTENSFFSVKPVTTTSAPTSSIFGGTSVSTPSGSIFGSTTALGTAFGAAISTTTQPTTNVFEMSSTTPSSGISVFGASGTTPSTGGSIFGTSKTMQGSGTSVFGASNTPQNTSTPIFGGNSVPQNSGTSVFGATSPTQSPSSIFGGTSSTITTPAFGSTAVTTTSTSIFGSSAVTNSGSIFGGGATASPIVPSVFGATPAATTPSNIFGSSTSPSAGIFGTAVANSNTSGGSSLFGSPAVIGGSSPMFGGATSPGGAMSSSSIFGQPSAFGAKPVFGSSATGTFGSGFGSPPSFGGAPTTGFASSPLGGANSPMGGASPGKVFGSSTFEALGSQTGGLSFGSLAQRTPEADKPQAIQGSSSFSSWR